MKNFSRRNFLQGVAATAGVTAASKLLSGGLVGRARAQFAPARAVLLNFYTFGGFSNIFGNAQPWLNNYFGVTSSNVTQLNSALMVDSGFASVIPSAFHGNVGVIGYTTNSTSHSDSPNITYQFNNTQWVNALADAMGGPAALKCVTVGDSGMPGPNNAVNSTSNQGITDISALLAALGGLNDPTVPNRAIASAGLTSGQSMSSPLMSSNPLALESLQNAYVSGIMALNQPVPVFSYASVAQAYGFSSNNTAISNFTMQLAAAEVAIQAGANVINLVPMGINFGDMDDHGDNSMQQPRSAFMSVMAGPLTTFFSRNLPRSDINLVMTWQGDFWRTDSGTNHANCIGVPVIGPTVKAGNFAQASAQGPNLANAPPPNALWSTVAGLCGLSNTANPFGAPMYPGLVA